MEAETAEQAQQALRAGADAVLLDGFCLRSWAGAAGAAAAGAGGGAGALRGETGSAEGPTRPEAWI